MLLTKKTIKHHITHSELRQWGMSYQFYALAILPPRNELPVPLGSSCLDVCRERKTLPRSGIEHRPLCCQTHGLTYLLTYSLTYLLTYLLTYSMVQSPSWEANWFAASQEIPLISRNPKDHYRTRKRPPPVSILGQPNPVHSPIFHLLEIHPNIIHPSTPRSPQWSTHRNTTYPVYWDGQKLNITIPGRLQTAYNL